MTTIKIAEHDLVKKLVNEYGYTELEKLLQTQFYIQKGYLKDNDSYKSFLKRVDSICKSFVKLRKKKGEPVYYELTNIKSVAGEIEDNRKGNGLTEDDYTMAKYFHMQLFEMDLSKSKTTYQWAVDVGALNPYHSDINYESIKKHFNELYKYDESEIIETFKSHIKDKNRSVGKNSINILKRDGLIDITNFHMAKRLNDEVVCIDKSEYDEFSTKRNDIIETHGLKHWNYEWALTSNNKKYVDYQKEMKALFEEYDIRMVWISIKITLLSTENPSYELNEDDFQYAYFNKMYHLLNNPRKKRTVKNDKFSSKFFKYNISYILDTICKPVYNFKQYLKEPHQFEINDVLHHKGVPQKDTLKGKIDKKKVVNQSDHNNVESITLDDILADVIIPEYNPLPFNPIEMEYIPLDSPKHSKELANAINNIKNSFSQPSKVVGFF